jgi:hypothetical protein
MVERIPEDELSDSQKLRKLAENMAEFANWQSLAASKGWKLPGNSPLPNESWIAYWQACDAYERDPSRGRPVVPHRSGGNV